MLVPEKTILRTMHRNNMYTVHYIIFSFSWISIRCLENKHIIPNDGLMAICHGTIRKESPKKKKQIKSY